MPPAQRLNLDAYKHPKRLIEYVDGVPVAKMGAAIPKKELDNILLAAASQEYVALDPVTGETDMEYIGLTNLEVAAIKHARKAALGDGESFRYMMDRLAGKAKQSVETVNVSMSLTEYLKQLELGNIAPKDEAELPTTTIEIKANDLKNIDLGLDDTNE